MTIQALNLGDRVRISQDYFGECLRGAIGTITLPPSDVKASDERWLDFWREEPDSSGGIDRAYWVEFDDSLYEPGCETHPIEAGAISDRALDRIQ
jgi:hypothetical protein